MGQRNKLLRFVTASEDEGDLRKLEEDIKRAFQQFQVLPFIWHEEAVVNKSQTVRTVDQGLRVFDIQERQLVSVSRFLVRHSDRVLTFRRTKETTGL